MKSMLGKYLKSELDAIQKFRQIECGRANREVSRNEAALLWIEKHAGTYRESWRKTQCAN
ncbi:MAG: hypothetical protein HY343_09730 [Lentisphaerae bacterium]|nr:hypothetical protein [Lentisphaerota bacterium]